MFSCAYKIKGVACASETLFLLNAVKKCINQFSLRVEKAKVLLKYAK